MTYLGWHDPDTKRRPVTPFARITAAVRRYHHKYNRAPTVVLVHPGEGAIIEGLTIQDSSIVPSGSVYVGEVD